MSKSWTNGKIPEAYSTQDNLVLKIKLLETELAFVKSKLDSSLREFENVYDSIKEYGYIELSYGKDCIVLVEKKEGDS